MMSALKVWIKTARLRTLPLAFASIILGTALGAARGEFDGLTFLLALLTTLFYQILSNYANDYGDGVKGTDDNRVGEQRAIASGLISPQAMKKAVILFAILAFISGTALSFWATRNHAVQIALLFTGLGILAIYAAIKYTVGDKAYGYNGLGDLSVLVFFGWLGVGGSFFLQTLTWDFDILLPATAIGFFAMAVLNLNNMRDIDSDAKAGKNTLALKLGLPKAKIYHTLLLILAFDFAFLYNRFNPSSFWQNLYFLTLPFLIMNLTKVRKATKANDFEPLLKQMALTTLLFAVTYSIGKLL
jgi:1,4-dihydroxy-2-naphthoate octaprenyltransferase